MALEENFKRWAVGAVAASGAEFMTFPLDTTKTRLQLQGELGRSLTGDPLDKTKLKGAVRTFIDIIRFEGISALYSGVSAAVTRQAVYGGIGIGLYHPVRAVVLGGQDPKEAPLWCVAH